MKPCIIMYCLYQAGIDAQRDLNAAQQHSFNNPPAAVFLEINFIAFFLAINLISVTKKRYIRK